MCLIGVEEPAKQLTDFTKCFIVIERLLTKFSAKFILKLLTAELAKRNGYKNKFSERKLNVENIIMLLSYFVHIIVPCLQLNKSYYCCYIYTVRQLATIYIYDSLTNIMKYAEDRRSGREDNFLP